MRGVRELERQGLRVRLGAGVLSRTAYLAGDDDRRGIDLVSLWANPEVKAVFAARGGYGSARIVDALTPAFLARHPKIFCGFSDNTTIHLYSLLTRYLHEHMNATPGLTAGGAKPGTP